MKYFIYTLMVIATGLMIYNATHLNFDDILAEESKTALIGVLAPACVIMLLSILLISKKIQQKKKGK
ncbi:hypothetical protein U6A24_02370 [Aquimarina gracilis]|uniref:Uncharacterized protein n=1 Tax=Aquimarina gracilis TaxID=874422 RepID=A0ABU5ZQT5_9FLAO|nr:hypothetical protein [Aquimarina gracilis]MEB3344284.1 hypothetical protein [Aquimarina gracilis]